jgi:hypothetical protein
MNLILTAFLTAGKDGQTGKNWEANIDLLNPLVNSFLKHRKQDEYLVVLNDCFDGDPLNEPAVEFIHTPPQTYVTSNRHRWTLFKEYLEQNMADNVFCVDCRDVEIFKYPFSNLQNLITGSEKNARVNSTWMRQVQQPFVKLPDYQPIIEQNKRHVLLNCGIIGGPYIRVLEYLNYICKYQTECNPPNNKSIDMAIHNYTIFKHFHGRFDFGSHINTDFRANEKEFNNKKALFRHK